MRTENSSTVADTHCKRCRFLLIFMIVLLWAWQVQAQSGSKPDRWGEMSMLSFGLTKLSGEATETLNDGWAIGLFEVHAAAIPRIKGLRIGGGVWEGGTNVFRLNAEEKLAMQEYEYVTTTNGHVTEREAVDKVYCDLSRITGSVKWYPVNNGIGVLEGRLRIRPYVTGGYAFHRITTTVEGGAKKWSTGSFNNYGIDFGIVEKHADIEGAFIRIEVVDGEIPDWDVRVLPELRPVRGGRYRMVRIGVGLVDLDMTMF